jgi:methionyl-tRNA formyltransferase
MPEANNQGIGNQARPTTRVVLFGMRCTFSQPTLMALAAARNVDLVAVVMPEDATLSDPTTRDRMRGVIEGSGARRIGVANRAGLSGDVFRDTLERIAPDIIIVACFPWRLPQWLLSLPPGGCINVHPSILPDGRGPEPIFWAFRRGLDETGVTLHMMDAGLDTGPIVSRRHVPIPDWATLDSLDRTLAEVGASLVMDHLAQGSAGVGMPLPQEPSSGHYARFPREDDLVVSTSWDVRHAARFIHAVAPTYGPVPVLVLSSGQRLAVTRVLGRDDQILPGEPVVMDGDRASIRFAGGTLACEINQVRQPLLLSRLQP